MELQKFIRVLSTNNAADSTVFQQKAGVVPTVRKSNK